MRNKLPSSSLLVRREHNKISVDYCNISILLCKYKKKHYLCIGDILTRPAFKLDCSKSKEKTKVAVVRPQKYLPLTVSISNEYRG